MICITKYLLIQFKKKEMLTSVPGHSLSTLNGKFLMKSFVFNALEIVIVDFLTK